MESLALFDLDNDMIPGTMRYIEEDGITTEKWEVKFGNGKHAGGETSETRIGVLKTRTKGVHDLLFGCDEIRKWNGKKYR